MKAGGKYSCVTFAFISADPDIMTNPTVVSNLTSATLSCNLTSPPSPIRGHYWTMNGKTVNESKSDSSAYVEYRYVPQSHVNNCN